MHSFVFSIQDIDNTQLHIAGGKGANLGELTRIEGIHVPDGFCISAEAFKNAVQETLPVKELLDQLSQLKPEDRHKINKLSHTLRSIIEQIPIPEALAAAIGIHLAKLGEKNAYAVRSSATAEDLPTASFAGQQDTYLNIIGWDAILQHISKCWASLFTERAVIYRMQNGFDHRAVSLAVIVQQMVFPQAAGILFTADPVTGNRKVITVDASFGLGEALVAGLVNADHYKVYNDKVTEKNVSSKKLAIYAVKDGGTREQALEPAQQDKQVLTDEQVVQLAHTGRKIEAHFGSPQDIEWCLADDTFYIVQSRPITTLFPVPEANDQKNHVYISIGHQQMMTDAMKPLGLSLWQLTAMTPMYKAAGRLFVDISGSLASVNGRGQLLHIMGQHDPLLKNALATIIDRNFIQLSSNENHGNNIQYSPLDRFQTINEYDPEIVDELIQESQASIAVLKQNIQSTSGIALLDFILQDLRELKKELSDPRSFGVFMTAMNAAAWINEKMQEWLGEKNAADILSQSVPNNITSEMGLELLNVADTIRPYPEVIAFLQQVKDDNFPDKLVQLNGGQQAWEAIAAYLDKYGMRCAGEIDITRARWSEKPTILVPMILSNIKNLTPGAGKRKFEQGLQEALAKEQELLERLQQLPGGALKAAETKRMINLVRNYIGYREYPKYSIVSHSFIYKLALLKEAELLVQANVIREKEDIYYFTFEELREVISAHKANEQLISQRKAAHQFYEKLTPPRMITSDGEIITGSYKREDLPANALVGLAVSSGIVEGRARVIMNMEDADLEAGDILVTTFTDPSWTPLFVSIKGLVTEVGGLMTHGAVIAREYGLPAVVGVENATRLIKDGQHIRVNGTDGYVEILSQ